jgi:hypothetical protein
MFLAAAYAEASRGCAAPVAAWVPTEAIRLVVPRESYSERIRYTAFRLILYPRLGDSRDENPLPVARWRRRRLGRVGR